MKLPKVIFSFFLMSVVIFAGPGLTWVEHYCSACQENTSQEKHLSCCRQEACGESSACCASSGECAAFPSQGRMPKHHAHEHQDNCKSVQNISFDWDASLFHVDISAASVALLSLFTEIFVPEQHISCILTFGEGESPPLYTPRGYLSFIRILLI